MYDEEIYRKYILQGKLREAVDYLKKFEDQAAVVKKYEEVFENGTYERASECEAVNKVCEIFAGYYKKIFWKGGKREQGIQYLYHEVCEYLGRPEEKYSTCHEVEEAWQALEEDLAKEIEKEGYYYQGGMTQGYYGPYIWNKTERVYFDVELPNGIEKFPVDMMEGFASCSWARYISFGKVGTSGWAGPDGVLACVKEKYDLDSERFKVDFLKHEAQHVVDLRKDPTLPGIELEYRAKMIQVIYGTNMKSFSQFLLEGNNSDPMNTHVMASYRLISDLSKEVFHEPYVIDLGRWSENEAALRKQARKLYMALK